MANSRYASLRNQTKQQLSYGATHDPVFPLEHAKQLVKCIHNSQLEIIEEMGHGLPENLCVKVANIIVGFIERGVAHVKS